MADENSIIQQLYDEEVRPNLDRITYLHAEISLWKEKHKQEQDETSRLNQRVGYLEQRLEYRESELNSAQMNFRSLKRAYHELIEELGKAKQRIKELEDAK